MPAILKSYFGHNCSKKKSFKISFPYAKNTIVSIFVTVLNIYYARMICFNYLILMDIQTFDLHNDLVII